MVVSQFVDLRDYHVQRTAQHGENGIIGAIFAVIHTRNRVCVDVGAFDLIALSNVYDLWHDRGWQAVLIESDSGRYQNIVAQANGWAKLKVINARVGWEGERALDAILGDDVPADLDLLSIDVDGADYHVWQGLNRLRPRVVIIEYNPTIPPHIEVVGIGDNYVGSSALALLNLGKTLGYSLVACTLTNLFFVLDEEAEPFVNRNDLPLLFDYSCINYVMTSYDGGMFFSNQLIPYSFTLHSRTVKGNIIDEERFYFPEWA